MPVADEERVLVEMACGAALAAVYSGIIVRLQNEGKSSPSFCFLHTEAADEYFSPSGWDSGDLLSSEKWLHQLLLLLILGRLPALMGPLLMIVCGGSTINMEQLTNLKHKLQS